MKALTLLSLAVLLITEFAVVPQAKAQFVGVIPSEKGCPDGAPMVQIGLDTEDKGNKNHYNGSVMAIQVSRYAITFRFCRVDGRTLFSLDPSDDTGETQYAVGSLDKDCPNGSRRFYRYFDTEDKGNKNWSKGPIAPNSVSKYGVKMYFCLFRGNKNPAMRMKEFPKSFRNTDQFGYGVFAQESFIRALGSGTIYSDDEDSGGNKNKLGSDDGDYDSIKTAVERIISGKKNTTMKVSQVVEVHD